MEFHTDVAANLGLLRIPAGSSVTAEAAMNLRVRARPVLVTGSQGEPTFALARIAVDKHRDVVVSDGDLVLHSRAIDPWEREEHRPDDQPPPAREATVVTPQDAPIHVSGHPRRDELALLIHLLRPKFLLPIHGEYRQLAAHAAIGRSCGLPARARSAWRNRAI